MTEERLEKARAGLAGALGMELRAEPIALAHRRGDRRGHSRARATVAGPSSQAKLCAK